MNRREHGVAGWKIRGCRCADCEAAMANYRDRQARYRASRKGKARGELRSVSEERARGCRCDSPIIVDGECFKCGREVAISAA